MLSFAEVELKHAEVDTSSLSRVEHRSEHERLPDRIVEVDFQVFVKKFAKLTFRQLVVLPLTPLLHQVEQGDFGPGEAGLHAFDTQCFQCLHHSLDHIADKNSGSTGNSVRLSDVREYHLGLWLRERERNLQSGGGRKGH